MKLLVALLLLLVSVAHGQQLTNLVLGGGGISIYAGAGAVSTLYTSGYMNLQSCTGVNDGATLCAFLAMNMPPEVINALLMTPANYTRDLSYAAVGASILQNGSVFYTSYQGIEIIELALELMTLNPTSTFAQLYALTGKYLNVVAYCKQTRQLLYFNKDTVPNMPIAYGVAASMAGPYIYDALRLQINGTNYQYWAGIQDNYPLHLYHGQLTSTVGVNYVYNYDTTNWNYNDTAEANELIGDTNLWQYTINPRINQREEPCEFTLNIYMPQGMIQYSHFLSQDQKLGLLYQGMNNMCTYITNRFHPLLPVCNIIPL